MFGDTGHTRKEGKTLFTSRSAPVKQHSRSLAHPEVHTESHFDACSRAIDTNAQREVREVGEVGVEKLNVQLGICDGKR
jgi:hypothetical protein